MTPRASHIPLCFQLGLLFFALLSASCGKDATKARSDAGNDQPRGSGGLGGGSAGDRVAVAGKAVSLALAKSDRDMLDSFQKTLAGFKNLTTKDLIAKHAVTQTDSVGYDPTQADGFELIQGSSIKLDDQDIAVLKKHGFVVSARQQYPTMIYGYDVLYAADLPVYISADSILDAVHRSYDSMLEDIEQQSLIPELDMLLDGMRANLRSRAHDDSTSDADFFLAVAKSLLDGTQARPVAGAKPADISSFTARAEDAKGHQMRVIFGSERDIDFSQFTPRGHYTDSEELTRYFRAMMWLGRIDLRLIETRPDGSQVFHRRQLDTAVVLHDLMNGGPDEHWRAIDSTVELFVGKSDYMRVPDVDSLFSALHVKDGAALAAIADERIAQTIVDGGYGTQAIASQLIVNATADGHTLPLDRSFALFGQRFVIDSQVLANVVYDRVPDRLMPDPLDAAFAALKNDQAAKLLVPELDQYHYAPALEAMRTLVDAHGDELWQSNLYNLWLSALRALSPAPDSAGADPTGLPSVAGTETWGRRILSTQLASWAQLRHDTILYAKQSYTSGVLCKFPDAYVDPYPDFFDALVQFAEHGSQIVLSGELGTRVHDYFANLGSVMNKLADMARRQQSGTAPSAEELTFINQAVRKSPNHACGAPPTYTGWYASLIYGAGPTGEVAAEFEPTIADVHTQPTDAAGNDVGRVLHVGTGLARLMVVTVDTCTGAKAYAGVASSYYETTTDGWQRLTDPDWESMLQGDKIPPDVAWTRDFVAHAAN